MTARGARFKQPDTESSKQNKRTAKNPSTSTERKPGLAARVHTSLSVAHALVGYPSSSVGSALGRSRAQLVDHNMNQNAPIVEQNQTRPDSFTSFTLPYIGEVNEKNTRGRADNPLSFTSFTSLSREGLRCGRAGGRARTPPTSPLLVGQVNEVNERVFLRALLRFARSLRVLSGSERGGLVHFSTTTKVGA